MKKVISGDELRKKMSDAISLLCGTVKTTLGPKGNNIIIDHSTFSPFITNDGVTIAENIESEDPVINTILELAKEASIKTNEVAGDGTTTTLVLLESIFNKGLEFINNGINPLIIKRELDFSLKNILEIIKEKTRKPNLLELEYIATISANDENIGKLVAEVYNKVKNKWAINVKECDNIEDIKIVYNKGYSFETLLASPYFLKTSEVRFNNPYLLLINDYINDTNQVADILNFVIKDNKALVIIAKDYSDSFINEIVSMYLENNINIILLKAPSYGTNLLAFYNDINAIIEGNQANDSNLVTMANLYKIKNIRIDKELTSINFDSNNYIKDYIKSLKKNSNFENQKNHLERIAMFKTGTAEILVGAPTKLERREKKMRIDDAIWAIDSCNEGILAGGGITLLEISETLNNTLGDEIFKLALSKPIEQILINSALDLSIIDNIRKSNYKKIYNINLNNYEDIINTKILDPTLVVINTLKNASSIAGMLLTTSSLVINEYQNRTNKINDYNEL